VPRIDDESLATKPAANLLVEPLIRGNFLVVDSVGDILTLWLQSYLQSYLWSHLAPSMIRIFMTIQKTNH
jgi:hypothetical protein